MKFLIQEMAMHLSEYQSHINQCDTKTNIHMVKVTDGGLKLSLEKRI